MRTATSAPAFRLKRPDRARELPLPCCTTSACSASAGRSRAGRAWGSPTRPSSGCCSATCAKRSRTSACSPADFYALERRIHEMAYRGAWRPVFDYLARRRGPARPAFATTSRGEKVLQGFLAALPRDHGAFRVPLGAGARRRICRCLPCAELGQLRGHASRLRAGAQVRQARRAGRACGGTPRRRRRRRSYVRYLADETLGRQYPTVRFTGLALVFHGWELVRGEAVPAPPASPSGRLIVRSRAGARRLNERLRRSSTRRSRSCRVRSSSRAGKRGIAKVRAWRGKVPTISDHRLVWNKTVPRPSVALAGGPTAPAVAARRSRPAA